MKNQIQDGGTAGTGTRQVLTFSLGREIYGVDILRVRFALQSAEFTPVTVIIVLTLRTDAGQREFGIVVDNVNDVVDIAPDSIKPAPMFNGAHASEYIEGITAVDEQMLILLNAENLASNDLSPAALTVQAA